MFVFLITISIGILCVLLISLLGSKTTPLVMKVRRLWIRIMSPILGLQIEKQGDVPIGPCLLVSNHRSFVDPVVTLYHLYAFPLAKAEISKYPLIGFGAAKTGVLYVDRADTKSRSGARIRIRETLVQGFNVLIYPEGTTNIECTTLDFKRGAFQVATDLGLPVVPMAIEYQDRADHWKEATLFSHYLYQFGKAKSRCRLYIGPPMISEDHLSVVVEAREWIDQKLIIARSDFDQMNGKP